MRTIDCIKKRFAEEDFDAVLERKATTRQYERKAGCDVETKLIANSLMQQ